MGEAMASVPEGLKYTREHEWAKDEGRGVRVGITAYAQEQLGDVVFVELPKVGAKVTHMQGFGVVESVKAVSDLFAPLDGTVAEVNSELQKAPELVNQDPYGRGWMIVITPTNPAQIASLMTAKEYTDFIAGGQ
jgi:glycine cleavage system H protein